MKTVLGYDNPIDADLDKSVLESEGIHVNLLNRESPLNAWGGPFVVQLQVEDQHLERAADLIHSRSPRRFGDVARVREGCRYLGVDCLPSSRILWSS